MLTEVVAERKSFDPEITLEGHKVNVVSPEARRRLAEPVHNIRTIREIAVPKALQETYRRSRRGQSLYSDHDVDYRLCVEIWHGCTANMLY
jgi:hypothetical protein